MLVLTRRLGEVIEIGENVTVTVCALSAHSVRIGIDAPIEIPIHRRETKRPGDSQGKPAKVDGKERSQG
jgi:carbon storage regulator